MLDKSAQKECPSCKEHFPCAITLKVHSQEHALPNVKQFVTDKSKLWGNVENVKSSNSKTTTNQLLLISYDCYICAGSYPTRELLVQHSNSHLLGHSCSSKQCEQLYGKARNNSVTPPSKSIVCNETTSKNSNDIEICTELNQDLVNIFATKSNQYKNENTTKQTEVISVAVTNPKNKFANFSNSLDSNKVSKKSSTSKSDVTQSIGSLTNKRLSSKISAKDKPYKCQICTKSYALKKAFRQHMTIHNNNLSKQHQIRDIPRKNKNSKCSICTEGLSSQEKLNYHTCPTMSKRGESFRCKICFKTFARKDWRKRHYLTSHNNGESCFRCEICGDIFPDEQFYLIHAQDHFSREIKKGFLDCHVCGRTFPGKELYERHSCRGAGVVSSR